MGFCGIPWESLGFLGIPWDSVGFCGILWNSAGFSGIVLHSMRFCKIPRDFVVLDCTWWDSGGCDIPRDPAGFQRDLPQDFLR